METLKKDSAQSGIGLIKAVVRRHKLLLVCFVGAGLATAVALLALLPPRYTASVSILLDPKETAALGTSGQFASQSVDSVKVGSVVSLLQSNELLDQVVAKEHLEDDVEFGRRRRLLQQLWGLWAPIPDDSLSVRAAKAAKELLTATKIARDGFTYIIKIDVSSRSPAKAQRLAQTIADTYIRGQLRAKYDIINRDTTWLSQRVAELRAELSASEDRLDEVRRTRGLLQSDSRVREAQRIAAANKQLYESYLAQFKQLEQRNAVQEAEARIVSAPRLPGEPSFPQPLPFLAGGAAIGLGVGLLFAFLRERTNGTFATPTELEEALGMPVLATIPMLGSRELTAHEGQLSIVDYAATRQSTHFAEGLRGIRAELYDDPSSHARTVQFTSAMPSEGKSTVAACVAVSAAVSGGRAILIDCDFRHPTVSKMFDCHNKPGLAELLGGSIHLDDALLPTKFAGLSVIPAGLTAATIPDITSIAKLKRLIAVCKRMADLVILDSAAIEAIPDAANLSQIVDESIVVVKWRSSDSMLVERALRRIRRANGRLRGVVLNSVNMAEASKYGYWSASYLRSINSYYGSALAETMR